MSDNINYSKREEDTYRDTVLATLNRIEAQTTKTNGRVTALETWKTVFVSFLRFAGYVIGAIAIPILLYILFKYL